MNIYFKEHKRELLAFFLIMLAAFFVYANSLSNGFVWDDTNVIVANPALDESPLSLFQDIDRTRDYELLPYYRPITLLTFWLEKRIHGLEPLLMHLFNVLLHAINALLVYLFARPLVHDRNIAVLAGLLFAVHPINTEAVNFLSTRNSLLSVFCLLSAYILHRYSAINDKLPAALAGAFLFMTGIFSKESALMVLPFILLVEITQYRHGQSAPWTKPVFRIFFYITAALIYLWLRWITLSKLGIPATVIPGIGTENMYSLYKVPDLWLRLYKNVYIIPWYMFSIILPLNLSPMYVIPNELGKVAFQLAAAWTVILVSSVWIFTRGRSAVTLFGFFWTVAFWLPVSGIIWFPSAPLADRYLYLPAIGIWLIAADQICRVISSSKTSRKAGFAVIILVLFVLSAITFRRNQDWQSDITLFSRVVQQSPDNPFGHIGLGEGHLDRYKNGADSLDAAEEEFNKALFLRSIMPGVHTKLGYIRLARGDNEGAIQYYTLALGIYPLDKEALINRAIAYENLGRPEEALEDFRRFLTIPGYEFADARPYAEERIRELSRQ